MSLERFWSVGEHRHARIVGVNPVKRQAVVVRSALFFVPLAIVLLMVAAGTPDRTPWPLLVGLSGAFGVVVVAVSIRTDRRLALRSGTSDAVWVGVYAENISVVTTVPLDEAIALPGRPSRSRGDRTSKSSTATLWWAGLDRSSPAFRAGSSTKSQWSSQPPPTDGPSSRAVQGPASAFRWVETRGARNSPPRSRTRWSIRPAMAKHTRAHPVPDRPTTWQGRRGTFRHPRVPGLVPPSFGSRHPRTASAEVNM